MKNSTRRQLLAKLGAGAAAVTTVAVAGTAAAGPILEQKVMPKQLPQNLEKLNVQIGDAALVKVQPAKSQNLQVHVAITKNGVAVDARPIKGAPVLGLSKDRKVLNLGVQVDGGGVKIAGTNALIAAAASDGRCNPSDIAISIGLKKAGLIEAHNLDGVNPAGLAQF